MSMSHHLRTWAAPPVLVSAGLLLTACGAGQGSAASEDDERAAQTVSIADPIVTTYDGGLYVLDGDTLEVAADIELEGFNRINPAGDDRHVMVSTAEGFQVLDAAGGELTDTLFPAEEPGHVVPHGGRTVLFADGSGEVTMFDTDALGDGLPEDIEVHMSEEAHHGVSIELTSGELVTTLGDEEERVGAMALDADGEEIARNEECPGVHGEATAEDEVVVIGCEDGVLIYQDGEFTKVDGLDDYSRIGNQAGSEESPIVLGDYKTDPDAELERPEQIALIDTAEAELSLVELPGSYTFRSLGRGPAGEALVLGTDGALHVIDPEEGELVDSIELMDSWEEPLEWQDPRPALFVRGGTAYVSDPATREIHAVDLESGEVTASTTLDEAPNELSGVTP
ncbi:prepilin-type processing-associated H-X9-DG protein [Nocardiopsis sp. Huas11]|uniref:zinc metallochaperone AztD n=1 Tax=Nocardiopsis sp. Huas11 TaxID=2183912 RepID=UPI000F261FB0|nr:zinc metallochaperone AztD [Nocardiopsis sp. Huas11]RKS08074.1 prepilin-type processing-associated H-X9-DG protein [Nocardiopsis sp. Huas11]